MDIVMHGYWKKSSTRAKPQMHAQSTMTLANGSKISSPEAHPLPLLWKIKELANNGRHNNNMPLEDINGTNTVTEYQQRTRWKEHFDELLKTHNINSLLTVSPFSRWSKYASFGVSYRTLDYDKIPQANQAKVNDSRF